MKKPLVWCVWYRGRLSGGSWKLLQPEATRAEAKAVEAREYGRAHLIQFRITRHEVEAPR